MLAVVLTGCTSSGTIIDTPSGRVNVGEVTAEMASVSVTGKVLDQEFALGESPLGYLSIYLSKNFDDAGAPQNGMIENAITLTLTTDVAYKGTVNSLAVTIDKRDVLCDKGLFFSACMTKVEGVQSDLQKLYRTKHSFIK